MGEKYFLLKYIFNKGKECGELTKEK